MRFRLQLITISDDGSELARDGHDVKSEDVARLSPLVFEHINLLGRYAFSVPEAVTRGELRPLRNLADVLEEVP